MGQGALQDLQNLQQMQAMLQDAGFLVYREGRVALSPKGVRRIGQLALRDIYANLLRDRTGAHAADHRGAAEIKMDETRPYAYGDPMHLDLVGTMKKSLLRTVGCRSRCRRKILPFMTLITPPRARPFCCST